MIFSKTLPCEELGFFATHLVHQDTSFELSNTPFRQFFIFFILLIWGVEKLPDMGKKYKRNPEKISNQDAKWNKKMGGRSPVITFGVFPV